MAKKLSKAAEMKIKKKKWLSVYSPNFGDKIIGETAVFEAPEAMGRSLKINMMNLIGDPRKQNIDVLFQVEQARGETAVNAKVKGYFVQGPALRKMVRRGKTKIIDSFKCYTADKKPVCVKEFILTRFMVNNSIATRIRRTVKVLIVDRVAKESYETFIGDVIQGKVQRELKTVIDKIYPLRMLEFYTVQLLDSEKGKFEKPGQINVNPKETDEQSEEEQPEEPKENPENTEGVSQDIQAEESSEPEEESTEETSEEETKTE